MYFNKKLNPYSLFNVNGRSCVTFNKKFEFQATFLIFLL
jgi:hypothetical protein